MPEFIGNCSLYQGDSREVLKTLPDASVDALVTDPPSGIAFMNKAWDKFKGRDHFIAFLTEVLHECFRVLRPGGYAFVWALPRTSHWTARAVEDAGFEIRDIEHHVFGQGYPKNLAIGKAIDKKKGKQRKVVGESRTRLQLEDHDDTYGGWKGKERTEGGGVPVTEPATEEAGEWEGHGTAVKPAVEHWIIGRKPIAEGTVAENVLEHWTGGLNIDSCRVPHAEECRVLPDQHGEDPGEFYAQGGRHGATLELKPEGRWPSNLVLSHDPRCVRVGTVKVKACGVGAVVRESVGYEGFSLGKDSREEGHACVNHGDEDGKETVDLWACVPGCPIRVLDEQGGYTKTKRIPKPSDCGGNTWGGTFQTKRGARGHTDEGGVSRYFNTFEDDTPLFAYFAKASKSEKEGGLRGHLPCVVCGGVDTERHKDKKGRNKKCVRNRHPTVKSVRLMRWLCRLATPPGGTILDCFMGSGSTGLACVEEGFVFIGIESDANSFLTAALRIEHALSGRVETRPVGPPLVDSGHGEVQQEADDRGSSSSEGRGGDPDPSRTENSSPGGLDSDERHRGTMDDDGHPVPGDVRPDGRGEPTDVGG